MNTTDTYTSAAIPTDTLALVIDGLRKAFVHAHADDQTADDAWSDDGAWTPAAVWSRVTDPACMARRDHFHACLRFTYHILGVRAAGSDSMTDLIAAIHHDC